jgi:hypothetical protein
MISGLVWKQRKGCAWSSGEGSSPLPRSTFIFLTTPICGILKEDADSLVAVLIARPLGEDLIAEAEELLGYFARVEAQVGRALDLMER